MSFITPSFAPGLPASFLAHVLQERLGRGGIGLLPDPLLTPLVRQLLPDREVMAVLMQYPANEVNGELEARLASRYIPSELIAIGLISTRVLNLNHADEAHAGGAKASSRQVLKPN